MVDFQIKNRMLAHVLLVRRRLFCGPEKRYNAHVLL